MTPDQTQFFDTDSYRHHHRRGTGHSHGSCNRRSVRIDFLIYGGTPEFSRCLDVTCVLMRSSFCPQAHGDIITGANQTMAIGSGKRRSAMADSLSNRSTLGLLQWKDIPDVQAQRPHTTGGNTSSQMHGLMMDSQPSDAPSGQSAIDR